MMKRGSKNFIYALIVIVLTLLLILILSLSGYLKASKPDTIGFSLKYIILFFLFNLIFIGIPASVHYLYVKDYSKIKNLWFFVLFGAIIGVIFGEGLNPVMLIPYAILMFIYAILYKKFIWWKVALTSYLAGIIIENALNRAPIQITTWIWISFFISPYFMTKIFENINKKFLKKFLKEFKWAFIFSIILGFLAWLINSRNNFSPPLMLIAISLPFIINIIYRLIGKFKNLPKNFLSPKTRH